MNYIKAFFFFVFIFSLGIAQSRLEEVERIQQEAIEQGNVKTPLPQNTSKEAPAGIWGGVLTSTGGPAYWSWVRAIGQNNGYTRWVHTSWWVNLWPYHSCFYCMNATSEWWNYIPMGQKYYIYAFRWLPADDAHAYRPPLGSGPYQPDWATGYQYSDVYLSAKYDTPQNGGVLSQEICPILKHAIMW